jgi:hypothetical protein
MKTWGLEIVGIDSDKYLTAERRRKGNLSGTERTVLLCNLHDSAENL